MSERRIRPTIEPLVLNASETAGSFTRSIEWLSTKPRAAAGVSDTTPGCCSVLKLIFGRERG